LLSSLRVAFHGEREVSAESIGTGAVNVTPGDYFEITARQTSSATKNVAAGYCGHAAGVPVLARDPCWTGVEGAPPVMQSRLLSPIIDAPFLCISVRPAFRTRPMRRFALCAA
jgi:hypothetical protein